jgi:hypothetical protein
LEPNSNLANPLTAMPVLRAEHPPGEAWFVCAVGGWPDAAAPAATDFRATCEKFTVRTDANHIAVLRDRVVLWQTPLTRTSSIT